MDNQQIIYELGSHFGKAVIFIRFEFDKKIIERVKKIIGVKWSRSNNAWYVLDSSQYRRKFGLPSKEASTNIHPINRQ